MSKPTLSGRSVATPRGKRRLVGLREDGLFLRRLGAVNAVAAAARLIQGDTPHRRLSRFLDGRFAARVSAPPRKREALFDGLLEFLKVGGLGGVCLAERKRAIEQRLLNFGEHLRDNYCDSLLRHERFAFLARAVASSQNYR